jgi:hypothetical protein
MPDLARYLQGEMVCDGTVVGKAFIRCRTAQLMRSFRLS